MVCNMTFQVVTNVLCTQITGRYGCPGIWPGNKGQGSAIFNWLEIVAQDLPIRTEEDANLALHSDHLSLDPDVE